MHRFAGALSFGGRCLHAISSVPNPYEQAISIIARTLSKYDDDNVIPCFGFGDGGWNMIFTPNKLISFTRSVS
jgi:E3 ubiquitin-protein ligase RGLG